MDYNKLFFRFKVQMVLEGILKTGLFSAMNGALSVFIVSFIYHMRIEEPSNKLLLEVFSVIFIVSFLPMFLVKYFPTKKKVAKRIDELGLQERISTMYEYRYADEEIYRLQRQDALVHLKSIHSRQIAKPLRLRDWLGTLICLLMTLLMLLLPYNVFAKKVPDITQEAIDKKKEEEIKKLIEDLRETIDNSDSTTNVKEELEDVLEQLEEELNDSINKDKEGNSEDKENSKENNDKNQETDEEGLGQAAVMDKAEDEMRDKIEDAISKDEIGEALQNNDLTKELGEAISKGDIEAAKEALSNLKDKLNADNSLVEELAQAVSDALQQSGIKPQDGLYMALEQFAGDLKETSSWVGAIEDIEKLLGDDIEAAQSAIAIELEKQSMLEALMEALEGILDAAKDEALGNERPENQEPGEEQGDSGSQPGEEQGNSGSELGEEQGNSGSEPGEEQGNGGQSGEQAGGSNGNGNAQGNMPGEGDEGVANGHEMNEGIYDPISGDVPYGDVYAVYFAKYLEALKAGEVPEELREIIEEYFGTLD